MVNKKIYIGVHKTFTPNKFDGYLGCGVLVYKPSSYKYAQTPFQFAVAKYGPKNFIRKTLRVFDKLEDALDLERWLVDEAFVKRPDTYNMVLGGKEIQPTNSKEVFIYEKNGNFVKEFPSQ